MCTKHILIFNSLKSDFTDISNKKNINFYVCGPTTYSNSHLGHARNYIIHDVIRRILEDYFLIHVTYVMNITDIDDKIINKATEEYENATLENCKKISDKYEKEFFDLMEKLGVKKPTFVTRVTEHILEMSDYVKVLIKNGYAYEKNGSYLFNSKKYLEDGFKNNPFNLKQINMTNLEGEHSDFCLLKGKNKNEPYFETDLGKFRPGWHLECSVMATHVLNHVDIHGGGIDLAFPHHTNEIIQSCAYSKQNNWCDVFFHCGHLGIEGKKMSKSEKNFTTIEEILNFVPPQQLRLYFLMSKNHQSSMDFSIDELMGLSKIYTKFKTFFSFVKKFNKNYYQSKQRKQDLDTIELIKKIKANIDNAFRTNFDTHTAIINIDLLINYINENELKISKTIIFEAHTYITKIFNILGIFFENESSNLSDEMIHFLLEIRNDLRTLAKNKSTEKITQTKLFQISDTLRDNFFPNLGVILTDK